MTEVEKLQKVYDNLTIMNVRVEPKFGAEDLGDRIGKSHGFSWSIYDGKSQKDVYTLQLFCLSMVRDIVANTIKVNEFEPNQPEALVNCGEINETLLKLSDQILKNVEDFNIPKPKKLKL